MYMCVYIYMCRSHLLCGAQADGEGGEAELERAGDEGDGQRENRDGIALGDTGNDFLWVQADT